MKHSRVFGALTAAAIIWLGTAPLQVAAQSIEELDALSDSSNDEAGGIQAARDQAARGEYLEALATLERVLARNPKSREARLIHAIYLCRIDDLRGGLIEIDKLKEKHYGKELLEDARAMCAPKEAA